MTFMKEEDADVTTKAYLTILQAKDLSKPKESKVLGSKKIAGVIKKCNPYVEISAYGHHVGYTPHISNTLNPDWTKSLTNYNNGVTHTGDNVFKMTLWGDHQHKVTMKLWHHSEKGDDPKRMGTAILMVPPKPGDVTGWIEVEKERTASCKKNDKDSTTKGQLRVRLQTVVTGQSNTKKSLKKDTMTKRKSKDGKKTKKKKKKQNNSNNNEQQITSPRALGKKKLSKSKLYNSSDEEDELPSLYETFTDLTSLYKEGDLVDRRPSPATYSPRGSSRRMLVQPSLYDLQRQQSENMASTLSFGDLQQKEDLPPLKIHEGRSAVYLKLFQSEDDILSTTKISKLNQRIKFIKEDLQLAEQQYNTYRKQEEEHNNNKNNNSNNNNNVGVPPGERRRSSMSIDPLEDIVDFLREENEILLKEVEEIMTQKPSSSSDGDDDDDDENNDGGNSYFSTSKTRVRLTIIRGQNLVAISEDETSDPFVEIYIFNQKINQTETKYHTLSPIWNEQFEMTLTREMKSDFPPISLKIYDEDDEDGGQGNSKMGQIDIPIPKNLQSELEYESDKTRWYKIPPNSAGTKDIYATGALQIKLELVPLVCHNFQVKQLESEAERLQKQLDRLNSLNQAAADAESKRQNETWLDNIISSALDNHDENESPLSATKEYLQQNNRELTKQLHYLRQL